MECFYREGGSHYYAIGMPMKESVDVFRKAGREAEADRLVELYRKQGDFMAKCGRNYPAHEVDYEQSIVAPAAIYMCELYQITGEETYLAEAARQLQVLELFQGDQPDYHLNQVAIGTGTATGSESGSFWAIPSPITGAPCPDGPTGQPDRFLSWKHTAAGRKRRSEAC